MGLTSGCFLGQKRVPTQLGGGPLCAQYRLSRQIRDGPRLCENSDVELARRKFVSITLNNKRAALAATVERRKERKQFWAFSARARFHTAWTRNRHASFTLLQAGREKIARGLEAKLVGTRKSKAWVVTNRARGGVGDEVKEFAQPCRRRFPTRFSNKCLALYVRLWKAAPNEEPLANVAFQAGLDKPMYRL